MTRTAASFTIIALALTACASQPPGAGEARVATVQMPYHAGQGVVVAVLPAPAPVSSAAGGTVAAASTEPAPYRLAIRMDDGKTQYVDTDNADIGVGTRVELGADRTIRPLGAG
jgi:outer membrane lipoprotein SlyB